MKAFSDHATEVRNNHKLLLDHNFDISATGFGFIIMIYENCKNKPIVRTKLEVQISFSFGNICWVIIYSLTDTIKSSLLTGH